MIAYLDVWMSECLDVNSQCSLLARHKRSVRQRTLSVTHLFELTHAKCDTHLILWQHAKMRAKRPIFIVTVPSSCCFAQQQQQPSKQPNNQPTGELLSLHLCKYMADVNLAQQGITLFTLSHYSHSEQRDTQSGWWFILCRYWFVFT